MNGTKDEEIKMDILSEIQNNMNKTSISTIANDNDDNTTVMGTRGPEWFTSIYTLKITFTVGEDVETDYEKAIKNLFKQIKRVADKKVFITSDIFSWEEGGCKVGFVWALWGTISWLCFTSSSC